MRSSRGALCALVVLGSLLVLTNAFGPFDGRNTHDMPAHEVEVVAQEAPVGVKRHCLHPPWCWPFPASQASSRIADCLKRVYCC